MTDAPNDSRLFTLIQRIGEITVIKDAPISSTTEIYFDLRISGQDLYELISWIAQEFEVDFSGMNIDEYAPSDGVDLGELFTLGLRARRYKSLTVGALHNAVNLKKWA